MRWSEEEEGGGPLLGERGVLPRKREKSFLSDMFVREERREERHQSDYLSG